MSIFLICFLQQHHLLHPHHQQQSQPTPQQQQHQQQQPQQQLPQRKLGGIPSPTSTISAANSCQTSPRQGYINENNGQSTSIQNAFQNEQFIPPIPSGNDSDKPSYSYAQLIVQAISASPERQLTLSGNLTAYPNCHISFSFVSKALSLLKPHRFNLIK